MTGYKRDAEEEIARPIPKRIRQGDSPEEHRRICRMRAGIRQLIPTLWPSNEFRVFDAVDPAQSIHNALNGFVLEIHNILSQIQSISRELKEQREEMQKTNVMTRGLQNRTLDPLKKQIEAIIREFQGIRLSTAMWPNDQFEETQHAENVSRDIRQIQIILAKLKNNSMNKNQTERCSNFPGRSFSRQHINADNFSWRSLTTALNSIKKDVNSLITTRNATGTSNSWSVDSILRRMDKPRLARIRKRKGEDIESMSDENMDYSYSFCTEDTGRPLKRARRFFIRSNSR